MAGCHDCRRELSQRIRSSLLPEGGLWKDGFIFTRQGGSRKKEGCQNKGIGQISSSNGACHQIALCPLASCVEP